MSASHVMDERQDGEKPMKETLGAVFENGTFRPLSPDALHLSPGQRVRLIVESPIETDEDVIELATRVYEGLSNEQIDEIERIALDRGDFFGDRST
jgi:predicted DNA-binding antitoxin AbrB/MazE fold protein